MLKLKNLNFYWALFLLAFIPLYPKFPLFNVPGTYVAIRLEDLFILITFIITLPYLKKLTRHPKLKNHLFIPLALFFFIGLISSLKSIFIYQITPPHLTLLHYLRRFEYLVPLFFFLTLKLSTPRLKTLFTTLIGTTLLIDIYAYGQKTWQWPVISTMNEEFSKGLLLKLTWLARVNSTFAGHYDLAIFLVLILNLTLGFYYYFIHKKTIRLFFWLYWFFTFYILVLTASRISIVTFFLTIPPFFVILRHYKTVLLVTLLTIILTLQSQNLNQRFFALLPPLIQQKITTLNHKLTLPKTSWHNLKFAFITTTTPTSTPIPTPTPTLYPSPTPTLIPKPKTPLHLSQNTSLPQITPSIATPTAHKATPSSQKPFPTPEPVTAAAARSSQIRFQVEWPRALRAFLKNPLIGTGYASLGLATDNDYLRLLGETGLLGFLSFLYLLISLIYLTTLRVHKYLTLSFITAFVSFLMAATFIDAFESSKIAYCFWMMFGLFINLSLNYKDKP